MNTVRRFGTFLVDRFSGRNTKNFQVREKIFTRANLLTFSGVLAVGFYIIQFTTETLTSWIPVTKIYVAATDVFDGALADYYNEHSRIGKAMDPWRDRLDAFAFLYNVWYLFGSAVAIPVFLIIFAEMIIFCEGLWLYASKKRIAEVHWIGKARMAVHQVCAFVTLAQVYWFEHFYIDVSNLLMVMVAASFTALLSYNFFHRKEFSHLFFR